MSKEYKSTEFSLHLSRSKMRKYLNNALSQGEEKEVELHLKHCVQCSNIIVEYVENEEAEHYKAHMAKLKGKLMSSVKPRKRKLTHSRIKVIRAAAAVVALFIFSFFALGSMAKKDFNFVSDAGKRGNALPELKTNQKQSQKPKANTSLLTEKKTSEVGEKDAVEIAPEKEGADESYTHSVAKKKPQTNVSKPIISEQKHEEKPKVTAPAKVVEKTVNTSAQAVADSPTEKKDDNIKKEEIKEKDKEVDSPEVEEDNAQVEESIQPLQKIEKIDAGTQNEVMPEAQNLQLIPNKGVGQLRQK